MDALFKPGVTRSVLKVEQEESWNNTVSKPDGSYTLPVGAGFPYNVMVFDTTGKWIAAAVEGVSGVKGATVPVPALTLTHGGLLTGNRHRQQRQAGRGGVRGKLWPTSARKQCSHYLYAH